MPECLLSTPQFTVERREYLRPNSEPIVRNVVVHPGAVVILPILDDRRIVMIRNYRYTIEKELWELPAGTMEPNEAPIETARRELEEETGYQAENLAPMMEFHTSPGVMTERMRAFVATGLTAVSQNLQGGERIVAEVVEVDDIRRRLVSGVFLDGKTIAVLATYFLRLEHGGGFGA